MRDGGHPFAPRSTLFHALRRDYEYGRREGWREGGRVIGLEILQPFVLPVYRFVRDHYFTQDGLRFAKIEASIMSHKLDFPDATEDAEKLLDEISVLCNTKKPLPDAGGRP